MEFTIEFRLIKSGVHISGMTNSYGTDYLNLFKEEFEKNKIKSLADVKINHSCPIGNNDIHMIHITDYNIVKNIKKFKNDDRVKVYVPPGFLGRYQIEKTKFKSYDGIPFFRKKYCEISFKLDENKIINDWIDAGEPEYWNCKIEDLEREYNLKNFVFYFKRYYGEINSITITAEDLYEAFLKLEKYDCKFCSDDPDFMIRCKNIIDFKIEEIKNKEEM